MLSAQWVPPGREVEAVWSAPSSDMLVASVADISPPCPAASTAEVRASCSSSLVCTVTRGTSSGVASAVKTSIQFACAPKEPCTIVSVTSLPVKASYTAEMQEGWMPCTSWPSVRVKAAPEVSTVSPPAMYSATPA